jgi:hypothetical protein
VDGAALGAAPHERSAASRGGTVGRHFKAEAEAFIRYLQPKIRNMMLIVNGYGINVRFCAEI